MKKTLLPKKHIELQFLALLFGVLSFLFLGYFAGEIVWIKDFQYFITLISGIFAIFIGILALVRFYTKKTNTNFLFIGIGFLGVGILDVLQVMLDVGSFESLFTYTPSGVYPLTTVISQLFLSLLLFVSWFVGRDKKKSKRRENMIMVVDIGIFVLFIGVMVYLAIYNPVSETLLVTILGLLALMFLTLTVLGYLFKKNWKYDNFDFWVLFCLVFAIVAQIFYLPFLNLEYGNMMNISVWARFFSYLGLLAGFLNSIYELYQREVEIQEELAQKNKLLKETKNKVEEAYMFLRKEKWDITKKKGVADKILKDIVESK
jgi:hypothetical protein